MRLTLWCVVVLIVLTGRPTLTGAQLSDDGTAALQLVRESMLATLRQTSWRASIKAVVEEVFEGEVNVRVDEGVEVAQVVSARPGSPREFDSYTKFIENGTVNEEAFKITIELSNVGVSGGGVDEVYQEWVRFSAVSPPDFLDALEVPIGEWARIGSLNPGIKELIGLAALLQDPSFVFNTSRIEEATFEIAEERDPDIVDGVNARVVFVKASANKAFLPVGMNLTVLQAALEDDPPTVREDATYWIDADSQVMLKSSGNVLVQTRNVSLRSNITSLFFDYNEPVIVPDSMTPLHETPGSDAVLG